MLSDYVSDAFESKYIPLRVKEQRVYSDEQVLELPTISKNHIHYKEWKLRVSSLNRFIEYHKKDSKVKSILEVGCGNGWFTQKISQLKHSTIIGLDTNLEELKQARRVFKNKNIEFAYGDVFEDIFEPNQFDCIVLNSSIQYFPDIEQLISRCFYYLKKNGEIHILDSPFYSDNEAQKAKKRSDNYFKKMNAHSMCFNYFHHTWSRLNPYNPTILYDPNRLFFRLKKYFGISNNLFPWIKICR